MQSKEAEVINEGQVDFITFKNLVEDLTGTPFEEIYNDYLNSGDE